jgi:NADH:ubiquinone oxidoreductase subunit 6 (subunit J)
MFLLPLVAVLILAVGIGLFLRRLGTACLITVAFLAILWILANQAIETDWHDADGFIDCWPHCTAHQKAIQAVFWLAPVTAGLLLVVALVSAIVRARSQR